MMDGGVLGWWGGRVMGWWGVMVVWVGVVG